MISDFYYLRNEYSLILFIKGVSRMTLRSSTDANPELFPKFLVYNNFLKMEAQFSITIISSVRSFDVNENFVVGTLSNQIAHFDREMLTLMQGQKGSNRSLQYLEGHWLIFKKLKGRLKKLPRDDKNFAYRMVIFQFSYLKRKCLMKNIY